MIFLTPEQYSYGTADQSYVGKEWNIIYIRSKD
jgi:hypothetical protein